MKRILVFSLAYYPLVGGAEIAVSEITDRIGIDEGFEWDLITLRPNKDCPRFEKKGNVNVYRIGYFSNQPIDLTEGTFAFRINKILYPIMACMKGVRLDSKRNYSAIWSIMASYAGVAGLFFKYFRPRAKFILTLQEGDTSEHVKRKAGIMVFLLKQVFAKTDCIQAISNYLIDFAKDFGFHKEIIVIPNGIDLKKFSHTASFRNDIYKIITTSRLVPKNGIRDLILSLKYLDEHFTLDILGTGPLMKDLVLLTEENILSKRVNFVGNIDQEKVGAYLKDSAVFVRPSLSEGLGNSFLEAMAAGIPIIGTKVGGIPDFLKDGETGLFCLAHDPKNIAEKILRITNDTHLRNTLVDNALNLIKDTYDIDLIVRRFKDAILTKVND